MATVSLKLDKRSGSQHKDGRFPLRMYLSHENKNRRIGLKHSFHEKEWDGSTNTPIGIENHKHIGVKLRGQLSTAEQVIQSLELELDTISIDELKANIKSEIFAKRTTPEVTRRKYVERSTNQASISQYFRDKMILQTKAKDWGSKSAVKTAYNSLRKFMGYTVTKGEDITETTDNILFVEFDSKTLKEYMAHLKGKGSSPGTIRAYLAQIRPLFYVAADEGDIDEKINPFSKRSFKMPKSPKTKKRALKMSDIYKIREVDLEEGSYLWKARHYFLFMFNNMGLNLIDLVQLRKSDVIQAAYNEEGDLIAGRVRYNRDKTEGEFSVKLTKESLEILKHYNLQNKNPDDFIFPYGFENTEKGRRRYEQHRKTVNRHIKKLGKLAEIDENVTTYFARHTWATTAKRNNHSVLLIQEALGHADVKTTMRYLGSFDDDVLDDANESITGN